MTVGVHLLGDETGELGMMLARAGVRSSPLADIADAACLDPSRTVVVTLASSIRPQTSLGLVNSVCLARGITWLPITPFDDGVAHVGPLVVPGLSGCLDCSAADEDDTLEYRAAGYRELEGRPHAPAQPASLHTSCAAIATLIAWRWITTRDPRLPGRRFSVAHDGMTISRTWQPRSARCRSCGSGRLC